MRPRVFIGSSGEAIDVSDAAQQELARDFDVTVWNQDVFRLSYDALDSLLQALDSSDAGVFVLKPDDVTESRGGTGLTVRDNVIFELGMFIGRLGRDRTFMLLPATPGVCLPSDLDGITTARYDPDRFDRQPRASVGPACTQIRQAVRALQPRIVAEPRSRARLDRAMSRMSQDLEHLLADRDVAPDNRSATTWPETVRIQLGRANVSIEVGQIQNYRTTESRAVIALPANEYFDDECISDTNSSLGAFVQHHYKDSVPDFGIVETMNERRLSTLTMPVLGSGHGGMPLPIAILFNLLAIRSMLGGERGRHIRDVRIIVFDGDAGGVTRKTMDDIVWHLTLPNPHRS